MKSTLQRLALIVLLFSVFVSVQAGTKTWKTPSSGGDWADLNNWTEGSVPATGDDVTINPSGSINITNVPALTINSLTINGSGTVNMTGGTNSLAISTTLAVNAGNTLDVGTIKLFSGTFNPSGTGVLKVANTIPLPATKTWTFDVVFNGTVAQQVPNGTYNNITIDNSTAIGSVAVYVGGGNITINGTLTLTKGMLACSNSNDGSSGTLRNIIMNSGATLVGGSSASYILASGTDFTTGTFQRKGVGTGSLVYPLGTAAGYSPITINNKTGSADITLKLRATASPASFTNAPFDATKVVNLEWYVKSSAAITADLTYQFNSSNFASSYNISTASEVGIYKTFYTATTLGVASGSNPYTLTTTGVGLSSTAIYNVIGNTGSVMNPNKDYLWNGSTSTDYAVAANWTPARNVPSSLDNLTISPSSGATVSITNVTAQTINSLTVNGSGTVTMAGGTNTLTLQSGGSFNIAAGTTLNMGTVRMALSDNLLGTLTTTGTGALITAATTPLPSTSAGTGITFTFDVTLNGAATQSIPRSVFNGNFTLNSSVAIGSVAAYVGGGDMYVSGTLTLTSGMLACSNSNDGSSGTTRNIVMNAGSTLVGGSSNSYILASGTFVRKGVGTTTLLYPLGTAVGYSPLTIKNNTGNPNITVKLKRTFTNAPADVTKVVNLEWSVLSSAATTADITFQFNDADKASAYSVGSTSELGDFTTAYTTSSVGVPAGSNPYTVSTTGLSIPTSGSNFYVIGNTYAVAHTAPTAPAITSITPGNSQLSVAFTAPSSDGGASISDYKYSLNGGLFTSAGTTSSPIVITGLSNGTSYNVQIKAVNAIGDGASSGTSSGTPRTVPGAPQNVVATAGNTRASIAFTAPVSNGGSSITSYTVTSSPGSFTGTGTTSPITVSGLTNGTAYTFTVTASNVAGTGSGSTSGSVTPDAIANNINVSTSTSVGSLTLTPVSDIVVAKDALLTINGSTTVNSITLAAGGQLTNSSSLVASTININSDGPNGTGTYVETGTSTITSATVNQNLVSGRNWYVSSPIVSADTTSLSTSARVVCYDETTASWIAPATTKLTPARGYISVGTKSTGAVSFYGTLNTGDVSVGLTRHTGVSKEGFNLVGNPYPSYLDFSKVDTTAAHILSTIWYRTKTSLDVYTFDTYNCLANLATTNGATTVTKMIPPMQAFWVRVKAGQTSGTLTFTNAMRAHIDNSGNRLKAPAVNQSAQQVLRLQVTNGTNTDETVIYTNPNASNGYDAFDSPKMSNNSASIPEIFTTTGTEQLVINGLNNIVQDQEIPLGLTSGNSTQLSIKATELSNFDPAIRVILRDYMNPNNVVEQDLTDGTAYSFAPVSSATSTTRFSLVFKSPTVTTGLTVNNTDLNIHVFRNGGGQITISCPGELTGKAIMSVFNAVGQKLENKLLTNAVTVLTNSFESGVYIVNVVANGKSTTQKVVIN